MQINNSSWVMNELANTVVARVQNTISSKVDDEALAKMLDLISGVDQYDIYNNSRQGYIKKIYDKEKLRNSKVNSSNFALDINDAINTFWEHVFKYLNRATSSGTVVPIRIVEGQEAEYSKNNDVFLGGLKFNKRNTKCNPIYYLRNIGVMGVRNLINHNYRRNIMQICDDCGDIHGVANKELKIDCLRCNSSNNIKYWPDGNSTYKSKKLRKCMECNYTWQRQFAHKCNSCYSNNVHTETRHKQSDAQIYTIQDKDPTAEELLVAHSVESELTVLLDRIEESLPVNPKNPALISKTRDIYNMLVRPSSGVDICKACVSRATQICSQQCSTTICQHDKISNPTETCGATRFSLSKCVNFSRKIGEYHKCSSSLAARRVKKVRQYVIKYINEHKNDDVCGSLHILMRDNGII